MSALTSSSLSKLPTPIPSPLSGSISDSNSCRCTNEKVSSLENRNFSNSNSNSNSRRQKNESISSFESRKLSNSDTFKSKFCTFSHSSENAIPLDKPFHQTDKNIFPISKIQTESNAKRTTNENVTSYSHLLTEKTKLNRFESILREIELQVKVTNDIFHYLNSEGNKQELLKSIFEGVKLLEEAESKWPSKNIQYSVTNTVNIKEKEKEKEKNRMNASLFLQKIHVCRCKLISLFNECHFFDSLDEEEEKEKEKEKEKERGKKRKEERENDVNDFHHFVSSVRNIRREILLVKNELNKMNGKFHNPSPNFNTSFSSSSSITPFSSSSSFVTPSSFSFSSFFAFIKPPLNSNPTLKEENKNKTKHENNNKNENKNENRSESFLEAYEYEYENENEHERIKKSKNNSNIMKVALGLALFGTSAAVLKAQILPRVNSSAIDRSSETHAVISNPMDGLEVDESLPLYQKALPGVLELSADNFHQRVRLRPTFIMFYAVWCPYCEQLSSTWQELALALPNHGYNVQIAQVNGEYYPHLLNYFDIRGFPTLVLIDGDEVLASHRGPRDLQSLIAFLDSTLP